MKNCKYCTVPAPAGQDVCTFCADYTPPGAADMLDQISMYDDVSMTVEHFEPYWFGVYRFDDMTTGASCKAVCRSIQLRDDSPQADWLRELIAGTEPYGEPQTIESEMWMGGEAVVTTYIARKEKQSV